MEEDAGARGTELRVDGGAAANNLLLQFQSDLFGFKVVRPQMLETTALGAAYLAGLAEGYWEDIASLQDQWSVDREFHPSASRQQIGNSLSYWRKAVTSCRGWIISESEN